MLKDLLLRGCLSSTSRYNSASNPYLSSSNTVLSRRKMRKAWEPAKQIMLFRISASWDKKLLLYCVHKVPKLWSSFKKIGSLRINVTLWSVRGTIVAEENQYELHNPSVRVALGIRHLKRMRRTVPIHCHLWPAQLYSVFPHNLTNGTNFGKIYWT